MPKESPETRRAAAHRSLRRWRGAHRLFGVVLVLAAIAFGVAGGRFQTLGFVLAFVVWLTGRFVLHAVEMTLEGEDS